MQRSKLVKLKISIAIVAEICIDSVNLDSVEHFVEYFVALVFRLQHFMGSLSMTIIF